MPRNTPNCTIIGFEIQPAQSLSQVNTTGLHADLHSLLFSLSYHPEFVSKVTLDLRYIASNQALLVAKNLDIVLLVRVDFALGLSQSQTEQTLERFRASFHDLLVLHLQQYEFEILPLSPEMVAKFTEPFPIRQIAEITRRITTYRPFAVTKFQGNSPMTRVVDMLLRDDSQCLLSVLVEPHILGEEELRPLEVYGYENPVLPGRSRQDDDLLRQVMNLQQISESIQTVYKMSVRVATEGPMSQYLVNIIGSEISGQRDFYYFLPATQGALADEISTLKTLTHSFGLKLAVTLDVPEVLLNMVYVFRPEEATSAFRLPTERISVAREKTYRTYPAPVRVLPSSGMQIGLATHPSYKGELPVYISDDDRTRHVYIVGKTGTGKSYELLNMICQDTRDRGVCVIDPHGDLVKRIFSQIPEDRADDVYYFNPAATHVMGLNYLETTTNLEEERDFLVQEVLSMLLRSVDYDLQMFGPIAQQWTRMACLALMETDPPGTLTDVPRLFTDDAFRSWVLPQVKSNIVRQWWTQEYAKYDQKWRSEVLGYFTSKFTPMVSAPQVRNIVGQSRSTINFTKIMNEGKILLVNLTSGEIGKINSQLLGSLVVSRLLWTALSRAKDSEASRMPFYLYVDEFQNFMTDSFESILSEARKYRLCLTVAHQHLEQLRAMGRMGDKIQRAVFGNIGTMICFRVGTDAGYLAGELGAPADAATLRNLANRLAVVSMQVDGIPSMPFTMRTVDWAAPNPDMIERARRIEQIALSKGRPVDEVAAEIQSRFGAPSADHGVVTSFR